MPELKLQRLPERTPIKLSVVLSPDLHRALKQYAALYGEIYGQEAKVVDLVPAMLEAFLAGDRGFAKARKVAKGPVGKLADGGR